VTAAVATDATVVPGAVRGLVEDFERTHAGATVTVWQSVTGGWRQIYPHDEPGGPTPLTPPGHQVAGATPPLMVDVQGPDVPPGTAEFLAAALSRVISYEREATSAARELTERYEEINLLYSISEILGSVLSMSVAARRILEEIVDVMGARRASLWVYEEAEQLLYLAAAVGEEGLWGPIRLDDPDSVTARVFRERQPLNVARGRRLPGGSPADPRPGGREAFLSAPINYTPPDGDPRTIGVITLIGGRTEAPFNASDTRLLMAIASQVGAALETHRLVRESVGQERLERELELAHDLQLKLLPDAAEFVDFGQIAARCEPAESVGGDFYHLIQLSGQRLGVTIGDISGHGFSAALVMALTISAVGIYAQEASPPSEVLRRVHRALIGELEGTEMYVTLFYGVLDPGAGRLVYSNAGHPHAFRIDGSGITTRLEATNPPIGTVPLDVYGEAEVPWHAGEDLLCLFTDGLSEAFAGGEAGLLSEVTRMRAQRPARILDHLFARTHGGRLEMAPDDRTAVLIRA